VFVIYDELDLAAAKLRVKQGGGNAGHNGMRSIDAHLGDTNYWRVRLGIGHPGDKARVTSHVLSDFSKADRQWVDRELAAVADELPALLDGRASDFMSRVAQAVNPPHDSAKAAPADQSHTLSAGTPAPAAKDAGPETAMRNALARAMNKLKGRS
jgi:PTH1 family peptidyl-tRNA hydrolase